MIKTLRQRLPAILHSLLDDVRRASDRTHTLRGAHRPPAWFESRVQLLAASFADGSATVERVAPSAAGLACWPGAKVAWLAAAARL